MTSPAIYCAKNCERGGLVNALGLYLSAPGDLAGAITLLRRAVVINEIVHIDNPEIIASALGNLSGRLEKHEATRDDAEAAYTRALETEEAILAGCL